MKPKGFGSAAISVAQCDISATKLDAQWHTFLVDALAFLPNRLKAPLVGAFSFGLCVVGRTFAVRQSDRGFVDPPARVHEPALAHHWFAVEARNEPVGDQCWRERAEVGGRYVADRMTAVGVDHKQ